MRIVQSRLYYKPILSEDTPHRQQVCSFERYPSSDGGMLLVLVFVIVIVLVIVIEYRARSGSLSGILALTLNPAALARRSGNRI